MVTHGSIAEKFAARVLRCTSVMTLLLIHQVRELTNHQRLQHTFSCQQISQMNSLPCKSSTLNGSLFPELSNFGGPPAEPGVYLDEIIIPTSYRYKFSTCQYFLFDTPISQQLSTQTLQDSLLPARLAQYFLEIYSAKNQP